MLRDGSSHLRPERFFCPFSSFSNPYPDFFGGIRGKKRDKGVPDAALMGMGRAAGGSQRVATVEKWRGSVARVGCAASARSVLTGRRLSNKIITR